MKNAQSWYNSLAKVVVGASIEVHRELGPGLLESVYEVCLEYELQDRGVFVEKQVQVPVKYKRINLNKDFYIDLLV